jgi:prepilin-type N-terminal cleavage/methylation domain-containing protein/prepilin-type processing-associated H-X9-DG protein
MAGPNLAYTAENQPRSMKISSRDTCRRYAPKAFTLIELLTVIAIIGILSAIIIVAVGSARKMAQQSTCTSNLRQIGVAFQLWIIDTKGIVKSRDHSGYIIGPDGAYPKSWVSHLNPYLLQGATYDGKEQTTASVFRCPVGKDQEWNGVSYAANIYMGGFRDPAYGMRLGQLAALYNPRKFGACTVPAKCVIVTDGLCKDNAYLDFDAGGSPAETKIDLRHNNGVNALFADGHVESLKPLSMSANDYMMKFRWNYGDLWPATN